MTILFFSATGNSMYVAKSLGGELKSIPQLEREGVSLIEDDVVGIISPVYFLTLPLLVKRYLKKTTIRADYIFGILTYGAQGGAATQQLAKLLQFNGNRLDYAADLLMVDNYLPGFKMEDEIAKIPQKAIDIHLSKIKNDLVSRKLGLPKKNIFLQILSNLLNHTMMGSQKGIAAKNNTDLRFSVTDDCNSCKVCERICPVSNIKVEVKPTYFHHCESCLACIHCCPQKAIQLDSQKSHTRFRNKNVSLKELITANGNLN